MSTQKFPRRSLPPASEMWGRDVESRIQVLENSSDDDLQNGNVNRTLNLISQQINTLTTTVNTVASQQITLAQTQEAQRLSIQSTSLNGTGFALSNTVNFETKVAGTLTVPTGTTSVLLMGNIFFSAAKNTTYANDRLIESTINATPSGAGTDTYRGPTARITTGMTVGDSSREGGSFAGYQVFSTSSPPTSIAIQFRTLSSSGYTGTGNLTMTVTGLFFRSPLI